MVDEIITRASAKALGLPRYFTNKPCKHGHVALRIVANGICTECVKTIEAKHRDSHREKFREKWCRASKKAQQVDPERQNSRRRRWAEANPDKVREKSKRWALANPDRKREHGRKWLAAHPGKTLKWRRANPDGVRKHNHTRRARRLNAPGSHTADDLKRIIDLQGLRVLVIS